MPVYSSFFFISSFSSCHLHFSLIISDKRWNLKFPDSTLSFKNPGFQLHNSYSFSSADFWYNYTIHLVNHNRSFRGLASSYIRQKIFKLYTVGRSTKRGASEVLRSFSGVLFKYQITSSTRKRSYNLNWVNVLRLQKWLLRKVIFRSYVV